MATKKIVFVINNLAVGGAESVFVDEIKALTDLGYECKIALLYGNKSGENVWNLNFKNLYDVRAYIFFIKKIRKYKPDVIYSTLDDANFVAKIVRLFVHTKLFCREANMTEDKHIKFKVADVILNFLVYKLVMVAGAVRDSYAHYDPFHKNKMVVLHNGVKIPVAIQPKNNIGPTRIMAVGSFTSKKGFEELVSICKRVHEKNENFLLEIIGDGPLFQKIQDQIVAFELQNNIKCLGILDGVARNKYYTDSHIFVLTSKKEGCPNVLLEAMAHGLAPVAYAVGGVPEIVSDKVSGILVAPQSREDFAKTLLHLIENHEILKSMGQAAREKMVSSFSFDRHIKNLVKVLEI